MVLLSHGRGWWCFVADSNRGSPACRAGALVAQANEAVGARSRTRTWECRCVRPMPWPLGEASAARRVGVAAARHQEWCTRKDLNLHAVAAAASEAAASTVSPRVHCQELIDGAATADRTPVSALPKRCPATGRLRPRLMEWCWLEDSNLPPLAYEASALPDELSQLRQLTNGSRRRFWSGSEHVAAPGSAPRPKWTFTMSKSAAPPAP